MTLLSIITINYNNIQGLKRTFASLFSQTYNDFEYIVIDGYSTDGSKEYITQNENKISFWISEPDNGIYDAMNKGIRKANGEYLLFLNSGDELYNSNVIQNTLHELDGRDIITGHCMLISTNNTVIKEANSKISFLFFYKDSIMHSSTFIKKQAFVDTGLYDDSMKISADWKWFLLGIFKYNLSYKPIDVFVLKFYMDGISSSSSNYEIVENEKMSTYKEHFPNYIYDLKIVDQLDKKNNELLAIEKKIKLLKASKKLKLLSRLKFFNINDFF